jgi:RHS repeat-associated protein
LLSAKVPETNYNAVTFTYKDSGVVATKTDPRGITTTYTYDSLSRPIDIKYSDGTPEVTFAYGAAGGANNGGGRLISTADGSGSKSFQYDVMGNVTNVAQTIAGATYTTQYSYNAAGELSSITYPSGRVVAQKYDSIGRFTEVDNNGASVYSVGSYNPAGQILSMNYGNGMSGQYAYNSRLQLAAITYGNSTGSILDLAYSYGGVGNNGQIQSVTDNLSSARSTNYGYDELSRLQSAQTVDQTSAGTWKLRFTYDRYGNRLRQIPVGGAGLMYMSEVLADPLTNHLFGAGQTYDAAGNMTSDGVHSYTYDAEGRITHVDGTANAFTYDGGGFRVGKNGIVYVAARGHVIAEYLSGAAPAVPNVEYIYAGGQRVATIASSAINYYYADHLSVRSSADSTGTVTRTYGHFPFGETWYETGTPDKWKFTTYERDADSEGGLDYANARFDFTYIGRFMSLDPLSGSVLTPQSLNHYAYVNNDPVNLTDPSGQSADPHLCMLNDKGDLTHFCAHFLSFGPDGSDPLAEGEALYNLQVFLSFFMERTGTNSVGVIIGPNADPMLAAAVGRLSSSTISGSFLPVFAPMNFLAQAGDPSQEGEGQPDPPEALFYLNTPNCLARGTYGPPTQDCLDQRAAYNDPGYTMHVEVNEILLDDEARATFRSAAVVGDPRFMACWFGGAALVGVTGPALVESYVSELVGGEAAGMPLDLMEKGVALGSGLLKGRNLLAGPAAACGLSVP